jgi:hypothetical protein
LLRLDQLKGEINWGLRRKFEGYFLGSIIYVIRSKW